MDGQGARTEFALHYADWILVTGSRWIVNHFGCSSQ